MRRYGRVDSNHTAITEALRKIGCSVEPRLAALGEGCPDLLVGYHGDNFLLEIKREDGPPSARRLTDDESDWHRDWRGNVGVVHSPQEAINYILASGR